MMHLSKKNLKNTTLFYDQFPENGFLLETCQRWILIVPKSYQSILSVALCQAGAPLGTWLYGHEIYLFLLRFASGLESEILGETDVFGQLKEAWRGYESLKTPLSRSLRPGMRWLFEDTKEIRTRFLQNLGGYSYGSLLRKLLKDHQVTDQKGIFLVGAGQLARAVVPFLLEFDLFLWNRTQDRLKDLYHYCLKKKTTSHTLSILTQESRGWQEASTIIVCAPLDPIRDVQRIAWLKQRTDSEYQMVHLGGLREQCVLWRDVPQFFCLTDMFQLQSSLENFRWEKIQQAHQACLQKSQERFQGVLDVSLQDLNTL